MPVSEVLEGLEASEAYRSSSLDEMLSSEQGSATVGELVGAADAELDRVDFRQALRPVLAELAPRERTIVLLRFFGNMTQTQIAQEVGISQMHVSRLLAQTLDRLRNRMDPETRVELAPGAAHGGQARTIRAVLRRRARPCVSGRCCAPARRRPARRPRRART